MFPVDNRFLGNTSIEYDNKYIAIWKVTESDKKNIDNLTASLIHEMFHAHQFANNEKRFFNYDGSDWREARGSFSQIMNYLGKIVF